MGNSIFHRDYSGFFPYVLGDYATRLATYIPIDNRVMAEVNLTLLMQMFWQSKSCALSGSLAGHLATTSPAGSGTQDDTITWTNPTVTSPAFAILPADRTTIFYSVKPPYPTPTRGDWGNLAALLGTSGPTLNYNSLDITDAQSGTDEHGESFSSTSPGLVYVTLGDPVYVDSTTGKYYLEVTIKFDFFNLFTLYSLTAANADTSVETGLSFVSTSATFDFQVLGVSIFKDGPLALFSSNFTSGPNSSTQTVSAALVANFDTLYV